MSTSEDSYPQLLSLAVHELRTPASVVGGYLRMLQRDQDAPLSDRQRKMVEEAERSCARLVAVIAEMSDVSKLDAGATTMARQSFDLFSLVQEVAGSVREAEDRGVRFVVRGATKGAAISGDRGRIHAAVAAVFRAILREKPSSCTVVAECRIDRRREADSAVLIVADEDAAQSVYQSTAGAFDDKRGGLGLALPIARRVIEGHGGRIWSPPGEAGRGAAIISFPLSE